MKKLGIYGGTFSPIHNGHINAARNFYDKAGLDELLIMPAYLPPHKQIDDGCTANERLEMARLAFEDEKRNIKVSDYEITQGGKSYTYLTLRHFTSDDVKLVFLTGTDMFLTLDEWKKPDEIMTLAEIALVRREDATPELDRKIAEKEAKYKKEFSAQILHIDAPTVEISSTEVRELAGKGEKIFGLVPEKVASYIAENKLYKKHSRDEIREEIKEYVGEKRYPHILGTEKECLRLAGIFGLDAETTEKLAVAALLHDITKILKPSEHISYMAGIGEEIPKENLGSAKTLHALTGAYRARELYPDEVDDTVFSAIKYHTTGKADMTLTEKLMYLADYIEPTRTFPECVALREYFDEAIKSENADDALRNTLIRSFDMTVGELEKDGAPIHPDTIAAREYLMNEKNGNKEKEKMEEMKIQPKELAEKAVKILDMHKAANIKLLRTEEKTVLADYFVICTASSNTQARGFMNELEYKLGLEGIKPLRVEGYDSALWILADYGSVIVHIFNSEQRQFYNLEKLWHEAEEVDISSLLTEN